MKVFFVFFSLIFLSCASRRAGSSDPKTTWIAEIKRVLSPGIQQAAERALHEPPVTVAASSSPRSAGGKFDFFSEGDYWWPDPKSADSPYVQRDGLTNPDNFTAHREVMIRFSQIVGSLASAYRINGEKKYADQLIKHCKAWFTDSATRMNPHLLYAQAIKGRFTGRGIGIIDAIQLIEVARALYILEPDLPAEASAFASFRSWFNDYLSWVTTHKYGIDEMNALNNHGTCWVMQVAVFARFAKRPELLELCRKRFKEILLPGQLAADGSFPLELKRTKPYGYSLFNLDAMATICQELSTPEDNLWTFELPNGGSMQSALRFMAPYVKDKSGWPYAKDVMYWDDWPVAHPSMLFGALAFREDNWFDTWKSSEHHPTVPEVIRNLPVRNPLIWL